MLTFDSNGFLKPYSKIASSINDIQNVLVTPFTESQTRSFLFKNYLDYTQNFKNLVFPYFEQWINGSFVTRKTNPNDIDIVTFLDARVYHRKEQFLERFMSFSLEDKGIDAYIVPVYIDKKAVITEKFSEQWLDRFMTSKADINDVIYPKGFLSIKF